MLRLINRINIIMYINVHNNTVIAHNDRLFFTMTTHFGQCSKEYNINHIYQTALVNGRTAKGGGRSTPPSDEKIFISGTVFRRGLKFGLCA